MEKFHIIRFLGKKLRLVVGNLYPLHIIESRFIKSIKGKQTYRSPIFIVGSPRSGSTLLYQLLTYYYRFSYFSNFSSIFYKFPILASYFSRNFFKFYDDSSFKSSYGLISGIWAPSEAGAIFNYWFGTKTIDREYIQNSVYKLYDIFIAPFISKNLKNSYRIPEICEIFPNAVFIHIKRQIIYNTQSILIGLLKDKIEMKAFGLQIDTDKEFREISCQVLKKIMDFEFNIERYLNNNCIVININYEELCNNYKKELKIIKDKLSGHGINLYKKNYDDINIYNANKQKISDTEWEILINEIQKIKR